GGFQLPGLAVWHAGKDRVQVAVSWQDGRLRTWEVQDGGVRDLGEAKDARRNLTTAFLPDAANPEKGRLLTGSFENASGRIRAWATAPGERPASDPPDPVPLADGWPLALTVFSGTPGRPVDHAAFVLRYALEGPAKWEYRLCLVKLEFQRGERFAQRKREVKL